MDELDALRQMRTTLAREENPDQLALRAGWRVGASPQRRRRAFKLPMVSLAAVTAVAAGSVAVLTLPSDPVGTGTGGPGKAGTVPAPGNALLVAATSAEKGKVGKYWHSRLIIGEIFAVGKSAADHYKVDYVQRSEGWVGRNGNGWWGNQDLPARPWTAQDKQKWQAAGSPAQVEAPSAEGPIVLFLKNENTGMAVRPNPDQSFHGLTPKQFAALPAEPAKLQEALLDLKDHWQAYAPDGPKQPMRTLRGKARIRALSDVAGTLLSTAPASPAVRAAAYRMLATLPGVKAEGRTTDPLGRTGTVISLPVATTMPLGLYTAPKQLGTYRRQWIIDPATGALMAIRDLVATPPRGSRKLPPGDDGKPRSLQVKDMPDRFHKPGEIASYKAYELGEWTDTEPKLPPQ
ncbi:CU044_5270 family protein [Actinomadura sp. 6N118]|uniref:CU044_5270 family protein n=1 Tax=Actinomadura sp. 6N118 TaxID=3375151 RepID=UPI0037A58ECB